MNMSPLQQSLLATLAYFDLFDYPLTLPELRRYRYRTDGVGGDIGMNDVLIALAETTAGERDGFYYLRGREAIVATRQRRYRMAEAKFAKARRAAAFLGRLPSVQMVAVCNSLAISNAAEQSDIDLFVVCRPGSLWTTRLLVVGLLHVFNLRPTDERSADTFCMSFFLSQDRLDISRLALAPEDTYLRYWIASLVPLYDAGGVMEAFVAANGWIGDRLPEVGRATGRKADSLDRSFRSRPSALRPFEHWAKRRQMKRFPEELRTMANMDSRVVVSDDILKFHVNDRRAYYEGRFRAKLNELGIMNGASSFELRASSLKTTPSSQLVR